MANDSEPPAGGCELVKLFPLPDGVPKAVYAAALARIRPDPSAESFAGELVLSPLLPAAAFGHCSAHLMTFGDHDQEWHRHFSERCLLIVTTDESSVEVSTAPPDAGLAGVEHAASRLPLAHGSAYLFRMRANLWHRFGGRFAAVSFHPDDSRGLPADAADGPLARPMGAFTAFPGG